jgi:ubiquinone/menaquinone biosynthesis C-methylase UbiE
MDLQREIREFYELGQESERLTSNFGWLERVRTEDILERFLPKPPARVLDLGGAAGIYALPLARKGYEVHLLDPIPLHVEQANEASHRQKTSGAPGLASTTVGDARKLPYPDEHADAVLALGPLYDLTERSDRLQALKEAYRTLRRGGLVLAVGISRFASLMDGFSRGFMRDPVFRGLVERDLANGQHRNETKNPGYFTTAFFHHPHELKAEISEAGFTVSSVIGLEGPAWCLADLPSWMNPADSTTLLDFIRRVETEETLVGASAHIMVVGRKQ